MKNPIPLPVVVAALVVLLFVIVGVGYRFVQDSQPVYLERSAGAKNKLGGIMKSGDAGTSAANQAIK